MSDDDRIRGKRCSKCGSLQPLYRFRNHKHGVGGKHPWCEDCASEYRNQRAHLRDNAEERYTRPKWFDPEETHR